jgi:multidrug resistance efflux pump
MIRKNMEFEKLQVAAYRGADGMDEEGESPILALLPRGYRRDRRFGFIYPSPPENADDLTQIRRIETREAVILNRLGVYFIAQIALWKQHECAAYAQELNISVGEIDKQEWQQQASRISRSVSDERRRSLPASLLTTVSLLACAFLAGLFSILILSHGRSVRFPAVLSAEITSIQVPESSTLVKTFVKAGDEVFTNVPLFELRKTDHSDRLAQFVAQRERLQRELQQAQARVALDLSWKTQEIERQIAVWRSSSIRASQGLAVEEQIPANSVKRDDPEVAPKSSSERLPRTESAAHESSTASIRKSSRFKGPGGILFFSGPSGRFSPDIPQRSDRALLSAKMTPIADGNEAAGRPTRSASISELIENSQNGSADSENNSSPGTGTSSQEIAHPDTSLDPLASFISELEALRQSLPEQLLQASGINQIQAEIAEITQHIEDLQSSPVAITITSPVHGIIGDIQFRKGETLAAGKTMVRILHNDQRFAMIHVAARQLSVFQEGSVVQVIFPGNQIYHGQVAALPVLADLSPGSEEGMVTLRINPTHKLWPTLPAGTRVEVAVQ